jgi:hypothetical protein
LIRSEVERLLQALKLLHRVAPPAPGGAGFRIILSSACGRRRWWRRGLRRFIGRAERGPGGDGKAGRDHCNSRREFHALSFGCEAGGGFGAGFVYPA